MDVLKPDVLKPNVLKPDVLWVYPFIVVTVLCVFVAVYMQPSLVKEAVSFCDFFVRFIQLTLCTVVCITCVPLNVQLTLLVGY